MKGSSTNAGARPSGSSAAMPTAVAPSVSHTVGMAPMRAPTKAQTSLPTAPPANTSVSASPTVGRLAPLAVSTNPKKSNSSSGTLQMRVQEQQKSHAGRAVEHADREQHREGEAVPDSGLIAGRALAA